MMSINRLITRPITRAIIRTVSRLTVLIQRVFITLNGTDGHFKYTDALVFASGDTFEFEFVALTGVIAGSDEYLVDGDDANDRSFLAFNNTGGWTINSAIISSIEVDGVVSSTYPIDGKLHKVKLTYSGIAKVGFLGCRFNLILFSDTIIANPKATISGVATIHVLGNAVGDTELNNGSTITYTNIVAGDREVFNKIGNTWVSVTRTLIIA